MSAVISCSSSCITTYKPASLSGGFGIENGYISTFIKLLSKKYLTVIIRYGMAIYQRLLTH
jgi:triphosphoribosyl-dephospho-CoA synthetase